MDIKKEIEKLKIKFSDVGKNVQASMNRVLKRKKVDESANDDDKTKPDNPNLSSADNQNTDQVENKGLDTDEEKDKKNKKNKFTEQDLKRKKILYFIAVIAIAVTLFVEDEEVIQQVQNAVKENVNKIASGDGDLKDSSGNSSDEIPKTETNSGLNDDNQEYSDNMEVVNDSVEEYEPKPVKKVKSQPKSKKVAKSDESEEDLDFDFDLTSINKNVKKKSAKKIPAKKDMIDLAKKIEKKALEESRKKEYKKVNYLKVGRGLAYNCKAKYWACLNKSEYFNCRDNKEHLELNKKPKECFPLEVYSSIRDCKIIQIHNINTLKKTDFCKGN
tara:strand:+ start:4641 stop:5630 length:990 start_codon:yes stop_codon:yes gene_type:complete